MESEHANAVIRHYVSMFEMERFLNDDLLKSLRLFTFPAYSVVFAECSELRYLYFLVEGQVQCSHYHMNGKLAVIALSTPFSAMGDLEILSEKRVNSNVIATQKTTMLGIAVSTVQRYGADDPRFLRFLIDQLREKIYNSNSLQTSTVLPVASRLALYILSRPVSTGGDTITLPDKESLASLLGTTHRHLNRVIGDLVSAGGIGDAYPAVRVIDRSTLVELVER